MAVAGAGRGGSGSGERSAGGSASGPLPPPRLCGCADAGEAALPSLLGSGDVPGAGGGKDCSSNWRSWRSSSDSCAPSTGAPRMARRPSALSVAAAVEGRLLTVMVLVGAPQATVVATKEVRRPTDARMKKI
jgi:hypothetical protein